MKNIIRNGKSLLVVLLFSLLTIGAYADTTPPPPPGGAGANNTNGGNNQLGGGTPVGGGIFVLLSLALGYGGKKFYDFRKKDE
jgi:hypothetical protein